MHTRRATLTRAALLIALLGGTVASSAQAQDRPTRTPSAAERDSLEQRVRSRMGQMMRTQLGLSDEQVRRLQATNRQFEGQRRRLFNEERTVRGELGRILEARDTTQDARLSVLLDQMLKLQRDRLALVEAEQKELATFLTPTQRARLFGMEEQIRRRMSEMRESGAPQRSGGRRPTGVSPRTPRPPL